MQGMPVDRMVSEIARRVPSGGGIGIGIPIMGGGGGDAEAAGDVGEGEVATGEMSDTAVEADRNATVASSGMSSDPHSSEGLFGDVAHPSSTGGFETTSDGLDSADSDDFTQQGIEFEEPTTDQSFEDDGTTFSTYQDESSNEMESEVPTENEEGSGLLGQLWDFFTDDD